ncbi:unnamed protein product [Meloidogyne enterolobii]|uniref:Uncharacterized protein n=1 Tax=Meloidogyne enterolobii TaxID=390850 RepID=A0ACB0ZTV8_MELEN
MSLFCFHLECLWIRLLNLTIPSLLSPKERPTFIRSTKHSRKSSTTLNEEESSKTTSTRRNSRNEDSSSYRSSRRHRRSRSRNNDRHNNNRGESSSMDKVIESRHQRSTMYFLQKDQQQQKAKFNSQQKQQQQMTRSLPSKPIQERIEALLARPDHEVLAMPINDLRALILQGVELFREQNHFLNAKKGMLSELDKIISREREEIDRLSKEAPPPSYRPPELPQQQQIIEQKQTEPQQQQHIAKESENGFGIAHILTSINDTFVHFTHLSGRETIVKITGRTRVNADRDEACPHEPMIASHWFLTLRLLNVMK